MKGNTEVIDALKDILTGELTAINQYFLHSKMCKDWGYDELAHKNYHESIEEMKHAEELIERILFLEGLPNLQKLGALKIGENVPEQLKSDLAMEMDAISRLRVAIDTCIKHKDYTSRELLEKILIAEESHVDWLESQLFLMKEVGVENYLAKKIKKES
ncbi:MAG: bacterioferritin [Oligoflexales bacterium]